MNLASRLIQCLFGYLVGGIEEGSSNQPNKFLRTRLHVKTSDINYTYCDEIVNFDTSGRDFIAGFLICDVSIYNSIRTYFTQNP